ncbi:Dna-binding storekeeper protein-related transcriptional regulator [Thalictrum thalictroides]|uniref:Dna-binding storekeeper protein-related transcriptional regulator n=1 Tax=Thalictrum thalictroides TaxID=46969 RepID=A0A7J6V6Y6_THATH|nr:Dna-binding storekeeper protein-related transcriptional regulator [Thalictrum thalictroides]
MSSISIKTAARKLPIKRKSPESSFNPNPNFISNYKSQHFDQESDGDDEEEEETLLDEIKPPPFKFHRIWTESDEIRFLQGLLDSTSQGLIFPRDLHLFYNSFSTCMSQPYTKSQLSEKLRRLRKKFRVISSRISNGLDASLLSEHDKALFNISKKLWDPNCSSESPFNVNYTNSSKKKSTASVSVKVSFNPTFTPSMSPSLLITSSAQENYHHGNAKGEDIEACEVEIDDKGVSFDGEKGDELNLMNDNGSGTRRIVAKTVMDVFDKSLEEVRMSLVDQSCSSSSNGSSYQGKWDDLMRKCREQSLAELDMLGRRMRLVVEDSIRDQ